MPARLIPLSASDAPPISLQRPVLLIGRHPDCDVRIDLPRISRRHCCVALVYSRVVIRDLGSHNGLRVNGRVVEEVQLEAGDEVAIGPVLYRLEVPEVAKPASSSKPAAGSSSSNDPDSELIPLVDITINP
jgi:pSer/pThr/pTyr-binding forkhead associated (FHA) protein